MSDEYEFDHHEHASPLKNKNAHEDGWTTVMMVTWHSNTHQMARAFGNVEHSEHAMHDLNK